MLMICSQTMIWHFACYNSNEIYLQSFCYHPQEIKYFSRTSANPGILAACRVSRAEARKVYISCSKLNNKEIGIGASVFANPISLSVTPKAVIYYNHVVDSIFTGNRIKLLPDECRKLEEAVCKDLIRTSEC